MARNASFTKSGPGRRPAHVNKSVVAVWDALIAAQIKAQKNRARKKAGRHWVTIGRAHFPVFHDDPVTRRGSHIYVDGNLVV